MISWVVVPERFSAYNLTAPLGDIISVQPHDSCCINLITNSLAITQHCEVNLSQYPVGFHEAKDQLNKCWWDMVVLLHNHTVSSTSFLLYPYSPDFSANPVHTNASLPTSSTKYDFAPGSDDCLNIIVCIADELLQKTSEAIKSSYV